MNKETPSLKLLGILILLATIGLFSTSFAANKSLKDFNDSLIEAEKSPAKSKARAQALSNYWAKFPDQPNDREILAMSQAWQRMFDLDFHAAMDMLSAFGGPKDTTLKAMLNQMPGRYQDAYKSYTRWLIEDLKGRGYREPIPYPKDLPQKGEGLKIQITPQATKTEKVLSRCEKLKEKSPFSDGSLIGFRRDTNCTEELFVWNIECNNSTARYTYTNVSGERKDLFPRDDWSVDVTAFHKCENGEFQICPACGGHGKITYEKTVQDGSWHSEGFNTSSIDTRRTTKVKATDTCTVCHGRRFSRKSR